MTRAVIRSGVRLLFGVLVFPCCCVRLGSVCSAADAGVRIHAGAPNATHGAGNATCTQVACWEDAIAGFSAQTDILRGQWRNTGFTQALDAVPKRQLYAMRAEAMGAWAAANRKGIVAPSKGSAHPYSYIERHMPTILSLYHDESFKRSLEEISGKQLMLSAASDPHAATIYYYHMPGDFIGWHYDTSFYYGERLTVLVPLFDNSSCELQVQMKARDLEREQAELQKAAVDHSRDAEVSALAKFFLLFGKPRQQSEDLTPIGDIDFSSDAHHCRAVRTVPGQVLFFDGDKVKHRVSALGEGELRVMLSLEYVTTQDANPLYWIIYLFGQWGGYFGFPWYVVVACYGIVMGVVAGILSLAEQTFGAQVAYCPTLGAATIAYALFVCLL